MALGRTARAGNEAVDSESDQRGRRVSNWRITASAWRRVEARAASTLHSARTSPCGRDSARTWPRVGARPRRNLSRSLMLVHADAPRRASHLRHPFYAPPPPPPHYLIYLRVIQRHVYAVAPTYSPLSCALHLPPCPHPPPNSMTPHLHVAQR